MFRTSLLIVFIFCVGFSGGVYAQDVNQRTQALVAALDKTKYKKKEKANISIELYIDVKNTATVKSSPSEYSGVYESEGYWLDLTVGQNGAASGSGHDTLGPQARVVNFTLRDARVEGALLAGTKVYENGETQNFEAVFANRTVSNGTNPNNITGRDTSYGVGFIQNSGSWTSRVFLERH